MIPTHRQKNLEKTGHLKKHYQSAILDNKNLISALFVIAITGATVAPAFLTLRLHHIILFAAVLGIIFFEKGILYKRYSMGELLLLICFLFIPLISGIYSKYLFIGFNPIKELLLFFWTAITWAFFLKYADQWDWKKVLYVIILGDIFAVLYVIQAIIRNDFYIATTESSYSYMIALIALMFYKFSPENRNVKLSILIFNLFLSLLILLFFSTSRGALLGLLCGLLGFSTPIFIAVSLIVLLGSKYFPAITPYSERLQEGVHQLSMKDGTAADRYILWGKIFRNTFEYPLGRGAGSYRTLIGNQFIEITESLYMEIMSAGGFLLLAIFLIFLLLLLNKTFRFNKKLTLFIASPYVMISTNPVGYHPIIPLYISIILFIMLSNKLKA